MDDNQAAVRAARPFEGAMLEQIRDYYRIGLTWSSNAIEGNTLTISETKVLLEDGLTVGGKPLRDVYEAIGHGKAYDYMFGLTTRRQICTAAIKEIHRLFYTAIDEKNAGVWRDQQVIVTGTEYAFPDPASLDERMRELELWMDRSRDKLHPVKFAAMLHLKFVSIHPFIDGNGRVSRLLMNLALIQDGYLPAVIPPVVRPDYLGTIRRYQQSGQSQAFCDFIAERELESQKDMMRMLHIRLEPESKQEPTLEIE